MTKIKRKTKKGNVLDFIINISKHAYNRMNERGVPIESVLNAFRFGAWEINDRKAFEFVYAGVKVIGTKEQNGFDVQTTYYV